MIKDILSAQNKIQAHLNKNNYSEITNTIQKELLPLKKTNTELLKIRHQISQINEYINRADYKNQATYEQDQISRIINNKETTKKTTLNKNHFLLFHYAWHMPTFNGHANLGDYVQTIALKKALTKAFNQNTLKFSFWDRDSLSHYQPIDNEKITCVMQAWLAHTRNFIPPENINPIWLGTHFDQSTRLFIEKLLCITRSTDLFKYEVGCRDLTTYNFLKKQKVPAYLSRCLTLTLPQRHILKTQTEVYLVNIPEKWIPLIPEHLSKNAIKINQRWVNVDHEHWTETFQRADKLLEEYRNKARLVITTALHVASPCLAMGIPVVLIAEDPQENVQRFSALQGLIQFKTIDDLKKGDIDFNPSTPNIEDLKVKMIRNLELSIRQSWGEDIPNNELKTVREFISSYKII